MRGAFLAGCATLLAAGLLAACGGSTALPVAACPTTASATSGGSPGQAFRAYQTSVRSLADALKALRDNEALAFPDRAFSGSSDFRPKFAAFADNSVCTATSLRALSPPQGLNATLDQSLDSALDAYIQFTQAGRDAVSTRDTSGYHTWFDGEDAKLTAVTNAANQITMGRRPFGP